MAGYEYVEEKYCVECGKNVGVKYCCNEDGSKTATCLSKSCEKNQTNSSCDLK